MKHMHHFVLTKIKQKQTTNQPTKTLGCIHSGQVMDTVCPLQGIHTVMVGASYPEWVGMPDWAVILSI